MKFKLSITIGPAGAVAVLSTAAGAAEGWTGHANGLDHTASVALALITAATTAFAFTVGALQSAARRKKRRS